jgi:hypothetical protein
MSDLDRDRQRQHWQAIAEQLGLSPELEPGSQLASSSPEGSSEDSEEASAPEPIGKTEEVDRAAAEEQTNSGSAHESAPVENEHEPTSDSPELTERETYERKEVLEESQSLDRPVDPKRGRRRGRQGETAAASRTPGREETSPDEEASAAERDTRRGRGRRGKKPASPRGEGRSSKTERAEEGEPKDGPGEVDDLKTLSNWTAPSWTELVASLYRPER